MSFCSKLSMGVAAVAAFACVSVAMPSAASAEDFGRQGVLSLSTDNLFGFAFGELEYDNFDAPDREVEFGIFGLGMTEDASPLWTPRLAIDGFVIDGLSIGGSLGFVFLDDDDDDFDNDEDDGTIFLIAPRVGYAYMFADWVGIWGRGGFTYYVSDEFRFEQDQLAIDLEGIFVFAIAESFGIMAGPSARIGLFGETEFGNRADDDYQEWGIGLNVGLIGWLGT